MPRNAPERSGEEREPAARTPRSELARLRESQERDDSEFRARITGPMLEACGELGYRRVTIRDLLERSGGYRAQFYRNFANKAECYAAAYEVEIERLCAALLRAAAAEQSWRCGLRAALRELARNACERPLQARGLLIEVHVAGGPALVKRKEMLERLTRAIDSARRETGPRHSSPPMTALFMVSAIEASVCTALERGEPQSFAAAVPELAHLVVGAYFDEEAAGEELTGARMG